jgi:hypothetical protein
MKKLFALCVLAGSLAGAAGCSYTAMAVAPDGTVYVAKNTISIINKIYACKAEGDQLKCTEAGSP